MEKNKKKKMTHVKKIYPLHIKYLKIYPFYDTQLKIYPLNRKNNPFYKN